MKASTTQAITQKSIFPTAGLGLNSLWLICYIITACNRKSKCFNCANIMKGEVNHRDKSWRAAAGMKGSNISEVEAKATGLQKWPFGYLKDKRYLLVLKHVLKLLLASFSEGLNPAALTELKIKGRNPVVCLWLYACVWWLCFQHILSLKFQTSCGLTTSL